MQEKLITVAIIPWWLSVQFTTRSIAAVMYPGWQRYRRHSSWMRG